MMETYYERKKEYVKKCMDLGKIEFIVNDWLSLEKTITDYHQVFKYDDEYGHMRYYTLYTYLADHKQVYSSGPYESLGFHSDQDGNPLCEDSDPFNNGDVTNTGSNIDELHYRSFFDLREECHYYWDIYESEIDDDLLNQTPG